MYVLVRDKRQDAAFLFSFKGKITEVNNHGRAVKLKWISNGPTEEDTPGTISIWIHTDDIKPYYYRIPPPEEEILEDNLMNISTSLFQCKY